MADGSLARRYARALVEIGQEAGTIDRLGQDLHRFLGVLDTGDGLLGRVLANPGLTTVERRGVLDAVLARTELDPMVVNFLRILVEKSRFGALAEIAQAYQAMADERQDRARATVVTARPLDRQMAERVRQSLNASTGKDVLLAERVDPSILGGMVVHLGDTVYDASIRARLDRIEDALLREPGLA